jgi:hypothetical protein
MDSFVTPCQRRAAPAPQPMAGDEAGAAAGTPPSPLRPHKYKVGWIDESTKRLKLKKKSGPTSIVTVETPGIDYFMRDGRKSGKLPMVFKENLFGIIVPHVAWKKHGGPHDAVCLKCFDTYKTQRDGQVKLREHAQTCWGANYCESLNLDQMTSGDRRRKVVAADGTSPMTRTRTRTRRARLARRGGPGPRLDAPPGLTARPPQCTLRRTAVGNPAFHTGPQKFRCEKVRCEKKNIN